MLFCISEGPFGNGTDLRLFVLPGIVFQVVKGPDGFRTGLCKGLLDVNFMSGGGVQGLLIFARDCSRKSTLI